MDKAGTFEYEIRKDFRNNQIVREVDARRLRDLWQSLGIGIVLVLVLLFSAWQHFELLRHGYKLEQMQRERASENDINRPAAEIERCARPAIEKLATEAPGMVRRDAKPWCRARGPQDPPAKSVVAADKPGYGRSPTPMAPC